MTLSSDPSPALVLKGANGQVEVYPNKVRIRRQGFRAKMTQGVFAGEKDIYFHQIGSVLVKQAGLLTNGYISFAPLGGVERRKGVLGTTHDENAVLFTKAQNNLVAEIHRYIEAHMGPAAAAPAAPAPDAADQLKKLVELRDAGIVTPAEYEAKRQELLARL